MKTKGEILKQDSYLVDCHIITRESDTKYAISYQLKDDALFTNHENGTVTCKLQGYTIIPNEQYEKLLNP